MLARHPVSAVRAASTRFSGSVRFNSSKSTAGKKNIVKPFYNTYTSFLQSQKLTPEGNFINGPATIEDFEKSELSKFVKENLKKRDELIIKRLEELSIENDLNLNDLTNKFNLKVDNLINKQKSDNLKIQSKIDNFIKTLSLPVNGSSNLINDLIDGLSSFKDNLNESAAFKFIYDYDVNFAISLSRIIRLNLTNENIENLIQNFQNGPISKITDEEYIHLKKLLTTGSKIESNIDLINDTEMNLKNKEQNQEIKEETEDNDLNFEGEVDGNLVLETIFSNLNSFENIEKAPLFKLIEEIDSSFANLLKNYETVDPSNENELQLKYDEILNYCSNKDSLIFKAFENINSPNFETLKKILKSPLPIDLAEIYEVFEYYPDYFKSKLFTEIEKIDSKFGNLLKELESVPEGEELDSKNIEIDNYLSDSETPIFKAMNDISSNEFKNLRDSIKSEIKKFENNVTPDKLVEYIIQNGLESECYKLVCKIDPEFSEILNKLCNQKDNEKTIEIYNELQKYLQSENLIIDALNDENSLNYKLLSDLIFPKKEEITTTATANNNSNEIINSSNTEIEIENQNDNDNELSLLENEDKSKLSEDVIEVNERYDFAISIINEIEKELLNNTFIPLSRKVSSKLDKLLGFQPSKDQIENSTLLKGKELPKQTDEVLELAVNIIMKDGKKEVARKLLNRCLYLLFLETRANPVLKFKEALDIVAPIVVTKTVKTGYAKNYTVPVPLTQRQRDRMALIWILKSCDSKASNDFSVRLCDEILHVLSGKSSLMDKHVLAHKLAIANRSYLTI